MDDLSARILELAIAIQQIPAPTFHERDRAEFVRRTFLEEGLSNVELDETGNVFARLAGRKSAKELVVSAHLDTVFLPNIDLHVERESDRVLGPGIGDNSLGVAGLFGLVWALQARSQVLPADLWLVANVCEEGLGNLRGMRAVVDRFGSRPLAYIVLEGMALGQVYQRGLGVRRYRVTVHTPGGHSWIDYGQSSAIHELTALSARILALELSRSPRTTLNIGIISGGTSVNTIASEAMLELDLRSEDPVTLEALARQVDHLVSAAQKPGVEMSVELIGQRPSGEIPIDHPLVTLARDSLRRAGIESHLNTGSTDANLPLSRGLPAITIGLTTGGRAHTVQEFINIAPLEKGMEQALHLVTNIWDNL
jgi:acetylornithine deacetylase/succinyl-diaminopimelate desuccinylase-like protein